MSPHHVNYILKVLVTKKVIFHNFLLKNAEEYQGVGSLQGQAMQWTEISQSIELKAKRCK